MKQKYISPNVLLCNYGTTLVYKIVCLKCDKDFFPLYEFEKGSKNKKELFCDDCQIETKELNFYINPEIHYSSFPNRCNVIGFKSAIPSTGYRRKTFESVYKRDDYTCRYCDYDPLNDRRIISMCCDHIIPLSFGGSNHNKNLVTACEECNLMVSDKVFDSFEEKKFFILNKRQMKGLPIGSEAFSFMEDFQ
ncbi:HNH endonuclease [Virgibacillus necropolis]|uniref:HNH nuclease domain-containing protein n=1 Tax=Virgibacillus necropolis TaxID=163877 RepID=A0A221MCD6_9BACI|nr:HNH endonuclease [Virgibacillus necropolis]ASN05305.1 hypothetical protein CFK40_09915 [Virgibacillus necropolis]